MTDVFISYRRGDRERCASIAEALQDAGYAVWFDARIEPGTSFDREIEREIKEARAVLVLWSAGSVDSDWVRNEARIGKRSEKLIAVRIDDCEPPLEFSSVQTIDLFAAADGERQAAWDRIVARIARLVERPATVSVVPTGGGQDNRSSIAAPTALRKYGPWVGGAAAVAALAVIVWQGPSATGPATATGAGTDTAVPSATVAAASGAAASPITAPAVSAAPTPSGTVVGPPPTSNPEAAPPPTGGGKAARPDPRAIPCNAGPYIIFYDWEQSALSGTTKEILDNAITAYFAGCNGAAVQVAVYGDRAYETSEALDLTRKRAASVARYLTNEGIPGKLIRPPGMGARDLLVPTADGVREPQNRRVEITIGPA